MIDSDKLIKLINKKCKTVFADSTFCLHHDKADKFRITGQPMSSAINRRKNDLERVKVLHWFDDFWLFIEIKFTHNITISISVFQGDAEDEIKHQLFRAEWDDYNNPDEKHPQPHWHITSDQAIEKTFEEYSNTFDSGDFQSMLKELKSEIININKIHFAMNGNWQNDENHVHHINDNEKIVKWFQGILLHLRTELTYIKID